MAASLITVLFLFFCQLQSASADPQRQPIKEITAKPGDDVTLSCKAPNNVNIAAVEWIRSGLNRSDPERLVYLKEDGHLVTADQDPSYVNRVQLKDDEMKNGELSLILKNVNNNDEGIYKCHYVEETGGRRKRDFNFNPNFIFHLNIKVPEKKQLLQKIPAQPGRDVTLPCQAPANVMITTFEWIRSGHNGILCTLQGRRMTINDPSYVNRVQLKDEEMKNGNLSLILKNVNYNDEGAFACIYEGMQGADKIKLMSIVYLDVADGDAEDGYKYGFIASVILNAIVGLGGLGGFVIYKKRKGRSENNSDRRVNDPGVHQQLQER